MAATIKRNYNRISSRIICSDDDYNGAKSSQAFWMLWIIYYGKIMIIIACKTLRFSHKGPPPPTLPSNVDGCDAASLRVRNGTSPENGFLVFSVLNLNYLLVFFGWFLFHFFLFLFLSHQILLTWIFLTLTLLFHSLLLLFAAWNYSDDASACHVPGAK